MEYQVSADAQTEMLSRLKPPNTLRARICWIMLVISMWVTASVAPMLMFNSPAPLAQRALAMVGLLVLVVSQILAYRRGRFPLGEQLLQGLIIGVAAATVGDFRSSVGLFYVPLFFRSMYGSVWDVALSVACYGAAYAGASQFWPGLQGLPPAVTSGELISNLLGFVNTGIQMKLVSVASMRHERAASRERSLANAGAQLVAARDADALQAAALEGVRAILAGSEVLRTALATYQHDNRVAVRAEGRDAQAVDGKSIDLARMPSAYHVAGQTEQLVVENAHARDLEEALGFALHRGFSTLTPLLARGIPLGLLVVETPKRLPSETANALATLASEVALALESVRLTDNLRQDIGRREALEAQLTELAYHDPLTGLANRAATARRIDEAIIRADERGSTLAVVFMDLDNFKVINDSLGHATGDQLLVEVARRLRAGARHDDLVARLGGDEFTLLLEDLADPVEAERVAARILEALREPINVDNRTLTATASIGIALRMPGECNSGDLLRSADAALYAAKERGKARVALYDRAMHEAALARIELESELRTAIEREELALHYQPLVSLSDGRLTEVEALVRWRHPRRGLLTPDAFIGLAEETGLIVPIGQWVLETACRQTVEWRAHHSANTELMISVNLSARQLDHATLVDDVRRALETSGLEPGALRLEITESVAVADTQRNRETLWALRRLGVQLAIDDFGTGSSALSYLRHFPIDTLKIDRSFVEGLGNDLRTTAMVRGIIAFAKSLGLDVTGEGVETAEQSAHLHAMGCDRGQGYLFARPVSAKSIDEMLADGRMSNGSPRAA